jgi:serine/threonine protein kinase
MTVFQLIRFGKYMVLDKIAVGGMAELFRAKITGAQGFEKLTAIKRILPHLTAEEDLVNSFIDEAKLAALLHHQNIVQIYDFGDMEGSYFIAMEHLFGKDFRHITNKSKEKELPLSLEYALYITSRICEGLDYAHSLKDFQGKPLNIIHRDISPPNIFITYDGEVKIVDFGIAKAASHSTMTQVGMIKGKVRYMSPEQADGKTIDHRSDIFSTGILLYEMVTGRQMFVGDTLEILSKVREAEFEPPERVIKNLPPKVYEILHRSLAKYADQRYQSNGEMLSDLEECMYQNSFRPTVRGLAQFMQELFEEEIAAEEQVMREAAQISVTDQSEGEMDTIPLKKEPEKTRVMSMSAEERTETLKRKRLGYGVLAVIGLVVIGAVFAFLFKEDPVSTKLEAGMGILKEERFAEAVALFEEALAGKPSVRERLSGPYAEALRGQAAAVAEKDPEKAKSLLLKAVELDPGSVQGHFQLGLLYVRLEDYPKAIETYQKVAEIDPQFSETFFNLGYVYALTKDYSRAEEMYGRVVELAPSYLDEALFNLAMVQEKQGKRDQSRENLERALTVNSNNKMVKKYLLKLKGKPGEDQ